MGEVILLDGKMMGFRAHFSHLGLRTKSGEPTGMLHGFLVELMMINKTRPEARIVVCWDGEGKTWRHGAFPAYKTNRTRNPEYKNLVCQSQILLPALQDLGLKVAVVGGVEADDMLGVLSRRLSEKYDVRIYSKDRDMYQLVRPRVSIWPDYKSKVLGKKEVEQWLGSSLEAFLEIRAMAGDAGDNLKGLPRVGPKTAVKLWHQGIAPSFRHEGFTKEDWDRVVLEKKLARIVTDEKSQRWTVHQQLKLGQLVYAISNHPGRATYIAEQQRSRFYEFLGRYELEEVFKARAKLYAIP